MRRILAVLSLVAAAVTAAPMAQVSVIGPPGLVKIQESSIVNTGPPWLKYGGSFDPSDPRDQPEAFYVWTVTMNIFPTGTNAIWVCGPGQNPVTGCSTWSAPPGIQQCAAWSDNNNIQYGQIFDLPQGECFMPESFQETIWRGVDAAHARVTNVVNIVPRLISQDDCYWRTVTRTQALDWHCPPPSPTPTPTPTPTPSPTATPLPPSPTPIDCVARFGPGYHYCPPVWCDSYCTGECGPPRWTSGGCCADGNDCQDFEFEWFACYDTGCCWTDEYGNRWCERAAR